jgi:hypothetical protein
MRFVSVAPQLPRRYSVYYYVPVSVAYGIIRSEIKYCKGTDVRLSYQQVTEAITIVETV